MEQVILEAERGHHNGKVMDRKDASNTATVWLRRGQYISVHFNTKDAANITVSDVTYANDGDDDVMDVYLGGSFLGSFKLINGNSWAIIQHSGQVGSNVNIDKGGHILRLVARTSDWYGLEVDTIVLDITEGTFMSYGASSGIMTSFSFISVLITYIIYLDVTL